MYGKARVNIPASLGIGPFSVEGLSDDLAIITGRTAARTLSVQDGFVQVTLNDGRELVIGHCELTGKLTIGRLEYERS